jgi:hypothetical protein
MRLIVARCSVAYTDRLTAHLPEALLDHAQGRRLGARARRRGRLQALELDLATALVYRGAQNAAAACVSRSIKAAASRLRVVADGQLLMPGEHRK